MNEWEDFTLDGLRVQKNQTLMIFSRPPGLNEEAWLAAGRRSTSPLLEFQADRFLVPRVSTSVSPSPSAKGDPQKAGSDKNKIAGGDLQDKVEAQSSASSENEYEFSLDGLAGLWLPYGGGQRMCPGRHFAKAEVLSTFALLFSRFELELHGSVDAGEVAPDLRWVPTGALPPASKVPFRMRRRRAANGCNMAS